MRRWPEAQHTQPHGCVGAQRGARRERAEAGVAAWCGRGGAHARAGAAAAGEASRPPRRACIRQGERPWRELAGQGRCDQCTTAGYTGAATASSSGARA